ncbi:MAG: CPBP family glutamic-type intramembrane protease [Promethearchaeota archaeon]
MSEHDNPIDEKYWTLIWRDHGSKLEKALVKTNTIAKVQVILVALLILLFFSVPLPLPAGDGFQWMPICQWIIRIDNIWQYYRPNYRFSERIRSEFTVDEFVELSTFIYKWLGYAAGYCMLYWVLFLSPFDKMRMGNTKRYIQEIVFENPKSPATFFKKSFEDQKFRWLGFFYGWCIGFLLCSYLENDNWMNIISRQNAEWMRTLPASVNDIKIGMIPITIVMMICVNVIFGIAIGFARPKTKAGERRKFLSLVVVAAIMIATLYLVIKHAEAIQIYLDNINSYITKRELLSFIHDDEPKTTIIEYHVNYHLLLWTAAMLLSGLTGMLFPVVCTLHQNKKIRYVVNETYKDVLENFERCWQYAPNKARLEREEKLKKKIQIYSALELAIFFGLMLIMLWGVTYYLSRTPYGGYGSNETMVTIGWAFMLGLGIPWALAIFPLIHYRFEKSVLYRGKRMSYVITEDRGVGSWLRYWKVFNVFIGKPSDKERQLIIWPPVAKKRGGALDSGKVAYVRRFTPEERAKYLPLKRFVFIFCGLEALWICGLGMIQGDVIGFFTSTFTGDSRITIGTFATLYMIIAPILLAYALKILNFNNPKDLERGKKRLYSLLFIIFLAALNIGIVDLFNHHEQLDYSFVNEAGDKVSVSVPESIQFLFTNLSMTTVVSFLSAIILMTGFLTMLATLLFPLFIRLRDLYESIPDLIKILFLGSILLTVWNYMCQWWLTDPRLHWSWLYDDPEVLRDQFHPGDFLVGVGGYHYWGWLQELLFLGYFCWLLYKVTDNKWFNATLSSLLFMMFHWDNIALMIGTAVGGFLWAQWFGKRRNLFMLGLMHGYNGTLVDMLIPMSMSVGPGTRGG